MKKPTIYQIKYAVESHGSTYFSRKNMCMFGQTLKDFRVNKTDSEHIFHISAPMKDRFTGKIMGTSERYFNAETEKLSLVPDSEKTKIVKLKLEKEN